jgi:hypothetical protein
VIDTTDAVGEARCHLMMGPHAGAGGVRILVPALGLEDTAVALVKPGRPVSVRITPADSALYVADSYQLRGEALDRIGNPIDTTAVFGTTDAVVSVTAAGLVTGRAYGRASITATIGGRTVAAGVSVVPRGTLAAYRWLAYVGDTISVVTVELNGSGRQPIAMGEASASAEEPPEHEMDPAWDPRGDTVAFHELGPSGYRIFLTGMDGAPRRLLPSPTLRLERHPAFSPDGRWIYFTGLAAGDVYPSLWRARRDGSGLERVPFDSTEGESRPQISPDGGRMAFAAGQPDREPFIRVRDLATGQATPLEARGTSPRWSPAGDLIAYVDTYDYSGYSGQLRVVRPDGSADRAVVSGVAYGAGVDWSPDGRFLVARSSENRLELIEVATGERIPLPYSGNLLRPSWRPERTPIGTSARP